jgi:hypothetical protein
MGINAKDFRKISDTTLIPKKHSIEFDEVFLDYYSRGPRWIERTNHQFPVSVVRRVHPF